jgi:uncharacterized protein DUF6311
LKADRGFWLSLVTGAVAFFALTRGAILDPGKTGWLLSHPDTATTFLGWHFFRQAPLVQLPFGANPAYGMEISTSVVFSDSIPLLAIVFKPFTGLLPPSFQYLGLWLLASFVLQAVLACARHLRHRARRSGRGLLRRTAPRERAPRRRGLDLAADIAALGGDRQPVPARHLRPAGQ